jgi:phage shock protein A
MRKEARLFAMSVLDLLARLRRLIASNVNALFDSLSDPGAAIDELIANMEAAARDARAQLLAALTEGKRSERHRTATEKSIVEWKARTERAVHAGDDGLAKEALARAAELQEELTQIDADRVNARTQITELERGLRDLDAKIVMVKARKETLKTVMRTRAQSGGAAERYDQIVSGVDAQEAANDLDAELDESIKTENVRQRIDRIDQQSDADARLAALKEKMKRES